MSDQTDAMSSVKNQVKKRKVERQHPQQNRLSRMFRKQNGGDKNGSIEKHAPMRLVIVDSRKLPQLPQENHRYMSNRISTTKYSLLSFLPKALMVQFMRVSNIYFLISAILTFIPAFSPLPGYSSLTPLVFVLAMSMMREAYEDFKRRRNDRITNNRKCRLLRSFPKDHVNFFEQNIQDSNLKIEYQQKIKQIFKECNWSEVKCGDLVYAEEGDQFSADLILLMSSAENGECFVQTSTLDGERTLKHKQCLAPVKQGIQTVGLENFQFNLNCEAPCRNLYEFNGFLESEQLPEAGTLSLSLSSESNKRTITLDSKQIILRGSNLANTNWIIGAVCYTGKESKLMLNQGNSRFKQSKIEKLVNVIVIYLIIVQAILCLIMSIYSGFFISNNSELNNGSLKRRAEYLFYTESQANQKLQNTTSNDLAQLNYSPTLQGVLTYGTYYILLNTLIPISLVVSIEFVKLIQTPFIAHDLEIYDPVQMRQAQPISMTLHEEMASIKYIFADKTGTLTANIMQFKACTIGSVCFDEDYNEDDYEYEIDAGTEQPTAEERKYPESPTGIRIVVKEAEVEGDGILKAQEFERYKQERGHPFNQRGGESRIYKKDSVTKIVWNYSESVRIIRNLLETKKYFLNEEINLGKSQSYGKDLILRKQNEYLHQFWLNCCLCHEVIATKHQLTHELAYQGTSPDEITLLDAAKELGYMFFDRTSDTMKIEIFGNPKTYRLLQKLDFTSDRKKMSVVVRDEDSGLICLFSKGADLAIFDRLSTQLEQHFLDATKEDLIKFSTKGYRTLCFAMRVLDEAYFYEWQERYEIAKLNNIKLGVSKSKAEVTEDSIIQLLQNELESNLFLLGATALEDKLQEGVPEVIEEFHSAGIKVWMLTGDKLETAENIGFSSKMFNEKMFIFKLQTKDKNSTRSRLNQIDAKIIEIEKANDTPIVGTQFILNPNAGADFGSKQQNFQHDQHEARNIIRALEEFKHESRASEYTINDSWARKPALRRKLRQRLEEIVPDKQALVDRLIKENQLFYKDDHRDLYIPSTFDMRSKQYIVRPTNVYRSAKSAKAKAKGKDLRKDTIDTEDQFGILVEGPTLQYILDSESMKHKFLKVLSKCQAVIVCRASPAQKGLVVQMIKESEPNAVTLAIGDGANDVNMIQRAHIGVGIFGKEGFQAAGNSDYAIGQFRFLRRLLFVHGRWSGVRLTMFMLFFFNKNMIFTFPQFLFGWFNGFSGQSFLDDMYLTAYNAFITAVAICTLGIWDQDISFTDTKRRTLIELFLPQLYKDSFENELFTRKKFLGWSAISVLQSICVYGIPTFVYNDIIFEGGKLQDFWTMSTLSYFAMVLIHYFLIFAFTRNWTVWMLFMYSGSFMFFIPLLVFVYDNLFSNTSLELRIVEIVFSDGKFMLVLTVVMAICILPVVFYYIAQSLLFPTLKDLILQDRLDYDQIMLEADPKKAQAAHDMFKQQQQQILAQWQMEYQNFQLKKNTNPSQSILKPESEQISPIKQDTPFKKSKSFEAIVGDSPQLVHLSRKGLSSFKFSNSQIHELRKSQLSHQNQPKFTDNNEDLESVRSENMLNQSEGSQYLNKQLKSYFQEVDNDVIKRQSLILRGEQQIQLPNQSAMVKPSKDI